MNILGNRGYECNDKFIKMIGSVNIDCINKFIKDYNVLVNSSNYISVILEDLDKYSGLRLEERVNTSILYNKIYNDSYKSCLDINRILNSNGTIDKISKYKDIDNEFELILDYFNDYKVFVDEEKFTIHDLSKLNDKYSLIKTKRR